LETLIDPGNPNPIGTCSLPAKISIGVSCALRDQVPQLIELFLRVESPLPLFNRIRAGMAEHARMSQLCGGVLSRLLRAVVAVGVGGRNRVEITLRR
jgi:hypothetical protein